MKNDIVVKIKKKYLLILIVIIAFACGMSGYYIWCSYHPIIKISVVKGGNKNLKVQTLYCDVEHRNNTVPSYVELNLLRLWMQNKNSYDYYLNNFKEGDIKLDIELEKQNVKLKYTGKAIDFNGEVKDIDEEIVFNYELDSIIVN